MMYW